MNTWEDFDHEARTVGRATKEQAPECVQLLQDAVALLGEGFTISENTHKTDATLVKMSLLSQNFASLKCSVDLALRGYYTQSVNLLRIVYENWIAFLYLSNCPDKAHFWLNRDKKPPGHSTMLKRLDNNYLSLRDKMQECYSVLCRFAHTDAVGILPHISTNYAPDETTIQFGSTYKDNLFKASAYEISQFAGHMLNAIYQWVPNSNEWHNKYKNIMEKIVAFIDEQNKKYESETS